MPDKEDYQVMLPMFYGTTAKVSAKVIAKNLVAIPAEQTIPPVEEVLATRDKK